MHRSVEEMIHAEARRRDCSPIPRYQIKCSMVASTYYIQAVERSCSQSHGPGKSRHARLPAKPRDPKSPRPPPKTLLPVIYSDDHTRLDFSATPARRWNLTARPILTQHHAPCAKATRLHSSCRTVDARRPPAQVTARMSAHWPFIRSPPCLLYAVQTPCITVSRMTSQLSASRVHLYR